MSSKVAARVPKVLIANLSAPELGYLAAELAARGQLLAYVRRYANQGRWWERGVAHLGARRAYERSLGRRRLVDGLRPEHVVEAGVLCDFAAALVARLGVVGAPASLTRAYGMRLHQLAAERISQAAGRLAPQASLVIAGAGMAEEAFRALKRRPGAGRTVLNFSSAHHRVQRRVFEEQKAGLAELAALSEASEDAPLRLQNRYDREIELADLILTGSSFAKASFVAEGIPQERVRVVPYGVDLRHFNARGRTLGRAGFHVLYVGRISFRKGIGHLLKAYSGFRKGDSTLSLVGNVVGDRRCLAPYEQSFAHSPHVPQGDLPDFYRRADVFVFPSLSEGMGLVALEAMACGCPVIVSSHGPSEVVRDGIDGFVVPAGDAEAIRIALEKLYQDAELRQRMSQSAQEQAARYSWERYARAAADDASMAAEPAEQAA
jgi:glycosyltransferase involved in cell wall biosynthesis